MTNNGPVWSNICKKNINTQMKATVGRAHTLADVRVNALCGHCVCQHKGVGPGPFFENDPSLPLKQTSVDSIQ